MNEQGRQEASEMGCLLGELGLEPDLILSSTAVRARRTTEMVTAACGYQGQIEWLRCLYLAAPEAYAEALADWGNGYVRVMVVGHNPGLAVLLSELTGQAHALGTATLAQVNLIVETWPAVRLNGRGELAGLWRP